MEYADAFFTLSIPDDKGVTQREHLEQVEKSARLLPSYKRNPLLDIECPIKRQSILEVFLHLRNTIDGDKRISDSDMLAFMELRQYDLSLAEVNLITVLDSKFMKALSKMKKS